MATSARNPRAALTEGDVLTQIQTASPHPHPEPSAEAIAFDPTTQRYRLCLHGGTVVEFAADTLWELKGATPAQHAQVQLMPSGSTLTWPELDVDISVAGLILDVLASPEWRRALRRSVNQELARTTSTARARAARENGKKGGRPRKVQSDQL